ncbi:hypothetical protein ACSBR2_026559 [Camellia fascicularis]
MVNPCSISIPIIKTPILFSLLFASFIAFASVANNVTYDHRSLIIDGQRKLVIFASIHYPRSVPAVRPVFFSSSFNHFPSGFP